MKAFEPQFSKGQMLAFRLRANPTVKRNGKRLGLYREEEQLEWLERKAEDHGFRLAAVRIANDEIIDGWLKRDEERHKLRLLAVRFDGVLQVDDPERFLQAVRDGIGSGKGLGCGLLSLARV
jgi:CRISPR system Cascade subunit CasE